MNYYNEIKNTLLENEINRKIKPLEYKILINLLNKYLFFIIIKRCLC
jgi:hypothetical protein